MKDLDILEKEILKSIERCSVYSIKEITYVYEQYNSFDKTIKILKHAVSRACSLEQSIRFNL